MTSEVIAQMLDANPVVIRRTMAALRDEGYVSSVKGYGGGWTSSRPIEKLTLLAAYRAVGEPSIFAVGPAYDTLGCPIKQAVNGTLINVFNEVEELLRERFAGLTLADIPIGFPRVSHKDGGQQCES